MQDFVVVVDMQQDFVLPTGALAVQGADRLIGPMQRWLSELEAGDTAGVLFTFDTHDPAAYADSPESTQFPLHCVRDSHGWNSVLDWQAVAAGIPVYRLEKSVFAMWEEPALLLQDMRAPQAPGVERDRFFSVLKAQGVRRVIVVGVAADFCVRWAIDGLVERGFDVVIPDGLTRGIERDMARVVADHFPATVSIE